MASESNMQPSRTPIMNSNDYRTTLDQLKRRNLFQRLFSKLHATPFIYTDELKPYSVNGAHLTKNRKTHRTKT